jgi:glucose dehydrogenase
MWRLMPLVVLVLSVAPITRGQTPAEDDWPMYGWNLRHTFSNPASAITPQNVARLQPVWSFPTGDAITASPRIVGGVVYIGAWDGSIYALDARAGRRLWQFLVDCQNSIGPVPPQCLRPDVNAPSRSDCDPSNARNTRLQEPSMPAFTAANGELQWQHTGSPSYAPTSVFVGSGTSFNGQGSGVHAFRLP